MQPLSHPIVVGVTGAGENTDALKYAISEARTLGVGLMLAHAVHPPLPPPPPSILVTDPLWSEVGARIVHDARRELEQLLGGETLPVTTAVHHGHPGEVLGKLSADASLIVLQHRDLSRVHRLFTASTVASVAAHARCPVISVPPPGTDSSPANVITVGVHADGGPREVLEAAFATAARRHCALVVLHAWRLAAYYDDMVANNARWQAEDGACITAVLTELQAEHPDVEARLEIRHEWPAEALVQAAENADLLVVGRHGGLPMLPARLGSVARAAVTHARCPVMIVPL